MSQQSSHYPELVKKILPPKGKLGVLLPGMGAVATTFIAGTHLIRKNLRNGSMSYFVISSLLL